MLSRFCRRLRFERPVRVDQALLQLVDVALPRAHVLVLPGRRLAVVRLLGLQGRPAPHRRSHRDRRGRAHRPRVRAVRRCSSTPSCARPSTSRMPANASSSCACSSSASMPTRVARTARRRSETTTSSARTACGACARSARAATAGRTGLADLPVLREADPAGSGGRARDRVGTEARSRGRRDRRVVARAGGGGGRSKEPAAPPVTPSRKEVRGTDVHHGQT